MLPALEEGPNQFGPERPQQLDVIGRLGAAQRKGIRPGGRTGLGVPDNGEPSPGRAGGGSRSPAGSDVDRVVVQRALGFRAAALVWVGVLLINLKR